MADFDGWREADFQALIWTKEMPRLVALLQQTGLKLATAESLTGGLLASEIVRTPGISEWYVGGAVTYSDAEKMRQCRVKLETLQRHTAVSLECAREMASGILTASGANIGVSTTGYADGGTPAKPAGTFYVGVSFRLPGDDRPVEYRERFRVDDCNRNEVRFAATLIALQMLNALLEGLT